MKIQKFLLDLEFILEVERLKQLGLTEEEIQGYFEFYADSWVIKETEDKTNYAN